MDARTVLRPVARVLNTTPRSTTLPLVTSRGHKTTARTKRSLKIAPHDSFRPDRSVAFPAEDCIIYNPPASEASPLHTPFIFLPSNDPRRAAIQRLRATPEAAAASPSLAAAAAEINAADLAPAMNYKRRTPKYHLTPEHIKEMRELRLKDPVAWSTNKLAKKFDCSPIFVSMAAPAPPQHIEFLKALKEKRESRWGPKKTQAREDRAKRAEMMYKGEL